MMRLLKRETTPPDGLRYVHAETGFVSRAIDIWTWFENIHAHRKANNLSPISEAEAEHQLCQQIPPSWCERSREDGNAWVNTRFGWNEFVEGMKAFGRLMLGGFQFVEQGEADRRARICANCFFNTAPEGCGACSRIASLITGDVAKKTTPYDSLLKACAVCLCSNKAKVWFPIEIIPSDATQQAKFPSFCWLKAGGENYVAA